MSDEKTIRISGKIINDKGEAVAGAFVAALAFKQEGNTSPVGATLADGVSNADGTYELVLRGVNLRFHLYPQLLANERFKPWLGNASIWIKRSRRLICRSSVSN